jgi:hypothetical protein
MIFLNRIPDEASPRSVTQILSVAFLSTSSPLILNFFFFFFCNFFFNSLSWRFSLDDRAYSFCFKTGCAHIFILATPSPFILNSLPRITCSRARKEITLGMGGRGNIFQASIFEYIGMACYVGITFPIISRDFCFSCPL